MLTSTSVIQVADVLGKHLAPEVLREAVLTLVHCAEGSGASQVLPRPWITSQVSCGCAARGNVTCTPPLARRTAARLI